MTSAGSFRSLRQTMIGLLIPLSACQQIPPTVMAVAPAIQVIPAPPPLAAQAGYAERRIVLTVQFGFDNYSIQAGSVPTLNNLVAALNDERLQGVSYEINGHSDLRGNFAHNIALSAMRAKSVSNFLRDGGARVPPIRAQGFGPLQLLYPAQPFNPENRRVEIIATGP